MGNKKSHQNLIIGSNNMENKTKKIRKDDE